MEERGGTANDAEEQKARRDDGKEKRYTRKRLGGFVKKNYVYT